MEASSARRGALPERESEHHFFCSGGAPLVNEQVRVRNAETWTRDGVAVRAAETTSTPPFKVHTLSRVCPARQVWLYPEPIQLLVETALHLGPGRHTGRTNTKCALCANTRTRCFRGPFFGSLPPLSRHHHQTNMWTLWCQSGRYVSYIAF